MITPDYLAEVMAKTQNSMNAVSEEIINKLARRLEATITRYGKNDLIPTSLNEIYNLEEAGLAYADIQKAVEEALPDIQEQVREAFKKGAEKMDEYYGGGIRQIYDENNPIEPQNNGQGATEPSAMQTTITTPENEPFTPAEKDKKQYNFPDFVKTTGYGNMLGLCGINCRHTFSMFFPNFMDSTPDKIDKKASDKKYQAEQQARAMEREIRYKKQILAGFKGLENEEAQNKKAELVDEINRLIKEYKNFCRENKISASEWRLATVDSVAKPRSRKNNAKAPVKTKNMSKNMQERMQNVFERTNGDIYNICQTTAQATQGNFINACDKAFMRIQQGMTINEAINEAIYDMAQQGVNCVYYNSGHKDRVEVALARAIRTGVNQANAQLILMKCAELGVDYVKVSSHYGARVTKQNNYTNHRWWQGKVYKLNWGDKVLSQFKNTNNAPAQENAQNEAKTAQKYASNALNNNKGRAGARSYNDDDYGYDPFDADFADERTTNEPLNKEATFNFDLDVLTAEAKEKVIEKIKNAVEDGHKVGVEFGYALDRNGNELHFDIGTPNGCMFPSFFKELEEIMKKEKIKEIILVHNHINNSYFSVDDVETFLKRKYVIASFVGCNNGDVHYMTGRLKEYTEKVAENFYAPSDKKRPIFTDILLKSRLYDIIDIEKMTDKELELTTHKYEVERLLKTYLERYQ